MLKLVKGAKVIKAEMLSQAYEINDNQITANIDADNIRPLFEDFIDSQKNIPLFLFIEVPSNVSEENVLETSEEGWTVVEKHHKDVYYLDGISGKELKKLLEMFYDILINDGLSAFGVGNPYGDEIGKYKYNIVTVYSRNNLNSFTSLFERNGISRTSNLITAWDTFTPDAPGESVCYSDNEGRDIYKIIEALSKVGLYKAEQREE